MQSIQFNGKSLTPTKIVCVGRNYAEHIAELGNEVPEDMVVFNKPNSAISKELKAVHDEALHYEGELAFIVEKGQLAGVGFGLDLTKRQLQSKLKEKGLPWERAKAFNGAAVFSDFVALPDDLNSLSLRLLVDDQLRQEGGVPLMMYPPLTILEQLQQYTHLEDGDIIMTGTPKGVGVIQAGETFSGCVLSNGQELVSAQWLAQ